MEAFQEFQCSLCLTKLTWANMNMIRKHVRRHESSPYFRMKCSFCEKAFTTARYWYEHISQHTEIELSTSTKYVAPEALCDSVPEAPWETQLEHYEVPCTTQGTRNISAVSSVISESSAETSSVSSVPSKLGHEEVAQPHNFSNELSSLVVHLRACHVSETLCRDVVDFVGDFTASALQHNADPSEQKQAIQACEDMLSFKSIERAALRDFPAEESQSLKVGDCSVQYLPLAGQLKRTYQNIDVFDLLEAQVTGQLRGPQDAVKLKHLDRKSLIIGLYYDAFQAGNPLGTHTRTQNIGAVYCAITNKRPTGSLDDVFICMLFPEQTLDKDSSWSQLLDPLIGELKTLEQSGIQLNGIHYEVVVPMLLGDNLGVHSVAGFTKCFSGGSMMCRHCTMSKDAIQTTTTEDMTKLRTRAQYDDALRLVQEEEFDPETCKAVGITAECPLTKLKEFHPTDSMPPDIMHDVLEGVAPKTVEQVLEKVIDKELVTETALQRSMKTFPYSHVDTNKPVANPLRAKQNSTQRPRSKALKARGNRTAFKQTASEAWCLLRLLPLILIHAGVSTAALAETEVFRPLVLLIHIMQILAAFVLSHDDVDRLPVLIDEFLQLHLASSPSARLTPKHHYMTHYATQIRRHGPLRRLWSMRFEGKHQILKSSVKHSKNRRNVCRSMIRGYQLKRWDNIMKWNSRKCLLEFTGALPPKAHQLAHGFQLYKCAIINGLRYRIGDVVVQKSQLHEIVCICGTGNDDMMLLTQIMKSKYESCIGAYVLHETQDYVMLQPPHLEDIPPMGCYNIKGTKYCVPRQILPGGIPL